MADVRKGAVLWKGTPTDVVGPLLKVGDVAPSDFKLSANRSCRPFPGRR